MARSPKKTSAQDDDEVKSPAKAGKASTPKSSAKKSKKKQVKEELKSKNTGVGLKIDISAPDEAKNKKIVFDEDVALAEEDDIPEIQDNAPPDEHEADEEGHADDSDDADDDAVEEVQGNSAREAMLEKMKEEEKFALRSKKKKKRKERTKENEDEDKDNQTESKDKEENDIDEFDDDFFVQLANAKEQEMQEKSKSQRKGKRTTFVFENEGENDVSAPRRLDHNIQVVVLNNPVEDNTSNAIAAVPVNALSKEALIYSRGSLANGSDVDGPARKKRKGGKREVPWRRSKKMNLLAIGRVRAGSRK
mmetsp:Transcript_92148/g.137961  ORF Transcript_92148/g.137961 Transcript_92148/m.137961 type:complete len:306 (+) Transcript_92148:43-960(+)